MTNAIVTYVVIVLAVLLWANIAHVIGDWHFEASGYDKCYSTILYPNGTTTLSDCSAQGNWVSPYNGLFTVLAVITILIVLVNMSSVFDKKSE